MLSHLRFHRRGASNPSSPAPEDSSSISPLSSSVPPQALDSASPHNPNPNSAIPFNAPLLPPITSIISSELLDQRREKQNTTGLTSESRPQQTQRLSYNGDSGFIGGAALRNYRRDVEAQQNPTGKDAMARISTTQIEDKSRHRNHRNEEVATERPPKPHMKKIMSFSTPSDVQRAHSSRLGRRPAGARLPPEAPLLMSNPPAAVSVETQRAKKGLPFLKNPMSTLLMRKKNNQPLPDLRPILSKNRDEEPVYDPRIRGTRVHDFSAPRKSWGAHITSYSVPQINAGTTSTAEKLDLPASSTGATENSSQEQNGASESLNRSSIPSQSSRPVETASRDTSSSSVYSSDQDDHGGVDAVTTCPPERDQESIISSGDVSAEAVYKPVEAKVGGLSSSVRTTRSRNKSLSEMHISAIPRHMKSTSSRFSFDMGGAAKQEKLLEERHRQRELARTTIRHDRILDSRFDEFDEDAFDYDAMMDDGGLEERIPGVNADFEDGDILESSDTDVEADPCNDQENFAGFVFQRSMTVSTSASPPGSGMMLTPRDADGNPIGVVMSNETTETSPFADFSQVHTVCHMDGDQKGAAELGDYYSTKNALAQRNKEDDLYYDDGMIGLEENEEYISSGHDIVPLETNEQPFDESIFDDNDTDQFGRPVPGAFQYAQSLRRATQQHDLTRENNSTSRLSTPPAALRCNIHLSLRTDDTVHENIDDANQPQDTESLNHGAKSIATYQAALAAAAHRAAATGKFRRSSSSSSASCLVEDDRNLTIDGDDDEDEPEDEPEDEMPGYDTLADDFDLGDDAIIAEANASALANDADGWYGQEFGFYSAPPTSHATTSYAAGASSLQGYEYANGGFFGPGGAHGLHRSTSGRMISREPNLTPITEKSEHSNRNSLMSLGNLANSTSTPVVQSPGLAQLAMMTDSQDDQMTLSALLKLRSRTWGGSQASLTPSREGSPRSEPGESTNSTWLSNPLGAADGQINHTHSKKLGTCLATCYDDEPDGISASGSPTMTMATASFDH